MVGQAHEFLDTLHGESEMWTLEATSRRQREIVTDVNKTGTYSQDYAELRAGAQLAWRNHARCIGRLHWQSLSVLDARQAHSAEEVFEACVEHLYTATNNGNLRSVVTVFAPRRPDGGEIRIWNSQLIRYAGYRQPDGTCVGDPLNADLTEAAERLGWRGTNGRFDVLPLVIQMPGEHPRLFDIPRAAILEVPITHPEFSWFEDLDLRWHALPAISDMRMDIGGLSYTACPFNGWYVGFEIGARNLSDESRYNQLPIIAERMRLDTARPSSLWKDLALVELNRAVLHSFQQADVKVVDHHTVSKQFVVHEQRESRVGRITPADWAWMVPPISSSTCPTFHRQYENPHLLPNFSYQERPF